MGGGGPAGWTRELSARWDEIDQWLTNKCQARYDMHANGVWFLDPDDAMLFKLTWAGVI